MVSDGGSGQDLDLLVEKLRGAGQDTTLVVALLWTWLEHNLLAFGSLREKPPTIYAEALGAPSYEGIDEGILEGLRSSPLHNAGLLLARVGQTLGEPGYPVIEEKIGFGGEEVLVFWRRSRLACAGGGSGEQPPSAQENPSISTLVPALSVCPRTLRGISLEVPECAAGPEWELVCRKLDAGLLGDRGPEIEFHLDPLGEAGLTKWRVDETFSLAALLEEDVEPEQRKAAIDEVRSAVAAAVGRSNVLLMPELAATDAVLEAIATALTALGREAPALTVVGRYHRRPPGVEEEPAAETAELGRYVNEAVVLGPTGALLWSQRKLSSAGGEVKKGAGDVVEDIRLGDRFAVAPTPLGNVGVAICLDAFAELGRERISRSPANVLLIPSLSPNVNRHRDSLQHLVQTLWGVAFVCNRSIFPGKPGGSHWNEDENRSFCAVQRRPPAPPLAVGSGRPTFVLRLPGLGRPLA